MARKFSERLGLEQPVREIQRGSLDDRLRNRLWSACHHLFFDFLSSGCDETRFTEIFFINTWDDFFGLPVDDLHRRTSVNVETIKEWFFAARWNRVYDFVQFLADFRSPRHENDADWRNLAVSARAFVDRCNHVLEQERSAYRFVDGELCEITDQGEIKEIEHAVNAPERFSGARTHLQTALRLYGDRDNPNHRNAIREAISAVEAALNSVGGQRGKNIGDAIKQAERKGLVFHSALKNGISSIYGWTSDEAGIRHALSDERANVSEAEARLMIVLCSAFVNYMVIKSAGVQQ